LISKSYSHGFKILIFSLLIVFASSFTNDWKFQQSLFRDDFEYYATTTQVMRAYSTWEDGARLDVSLEDKITGDGSRSMRIDVLGPNLFDDVTSGSIYHSLPLTNRNWENSSGIRFWIKNPSEKPLWVTFNFKEAYNEYWSINSGSPYLLESENSRTNQYECLYGNLIIPANFEGRVIIPMTSFSVPDWNTARGDRKLQLANIESFAIGVTLNEDYPRTFYFDSFEVLSPEEFIPTIQGVNQIQIPESGELHETYSVLTGKVGKQMDADLTTQWRIISNLNPQIVINPKGTLSIPAGAFSEIISVESEIDRPDSKTFVGMNIKLTGGQQNLIEPSGKVTTPSNSVQPAEKSDYDRFAQKFETWSMNYRPLFVILSVGFVVLVISLLSVFQNKLK